MDNFIGKRLDGRYLIQALIGSGGMANVYKAGDLKENRIVAVKILREECMGNEDLVRRFKNESKAISVLNHPNIVKVYDVSVSERLQYIVMEYVDGITLKDYMDYRKQPLTYKETIHFVTQTLLALQHAHAKGIVHRDIKPQNIMMLPSGNIKVMDFGIARFSRSENQTMTDKAIGSVHYISPEQAKGDVTDSKSDIYSVGVMMYEMLAGRLPFDGESPVGVAIKQISDAATPLRTINPAVPEGLAAITERAMAKEPRERYQSAGAMLADIEAFKRNPSIKFEYQYLTDTTPTRYMDKLPGKAPQSRPTSQRPATKQATFASGKTTSAAPKTARSRTLNVLAKRKLFVPILAGMAAAFLVASVIICLLLFKLTDNPLFSKRVDVELPNFKDMKQEEIQASEFAKTFDLEFVSAYNSGYEAGVVYDQSPKPPKKVKEGAHIILRVSKGVENVAVPDVVGQNKTTALELLKNSGFNTMVKQVKSTEPPFDVVQKLTLKDGTEITSGTMLSTDNTLQVYVSTETRNNTVKVPNCVGLTSKEDANTLLSSLRLVIGGFVEEANDAPAGTIIAQSPDPDTEVPEGTAVQLKISRGHEHNFVEDMAQHKEPTYTEKGKRVLVCSCGEKKEEEIPVKAHDHKWMPTDPATGQRECELCHVKEQDPAWSAPSSSSSQPAS